MPTDPTKAFTAQEIASAAAKGEAALSGFGAVAERLNAARHAKLERTFDSIEGIGRGLKREGVIAKRQTQELIGEVEGAVRLVWDAIFEPETFKEKHGLGDKDSGE